MHRCQSNLSVSSTATGTQHYCSKTKPIRITSNQHYTAEIV